MKYMFPVFTLERESTLARLDDLHIHISKSRDAQEGLGELNRVEGEMYNDLPGQTQRETEALGLELKESTFS